MSSLTIIYYPPIEISNQYSSSCHAMCHINYLYSLFIYNLYYLALYYYLTTMGKYITPKMKTREVFLRCQAFYFQLMKDGHKVTQI